MKRVSFINVFLAILFILISAFLSVYFIPQAANAAPQMADYCYLPPFVTDPNTPPNIMLVYEKGGNISKRANSATYTYDAANPYYGFFDSSAKYNFAVDGNKAFSPNYFEKSSACSPATDKKCISGDILNWALMTSLDLSRKALVGFGWPKAVSSQGAGDVYTYSGNFCSAWSGTTCTNQNLTPISYGQYEDGNNDTTVAVSVDTDGNGTNDYTYRFCMSKGNPEATVTVNGQAGLTAPSCPNPNTPAKCKTSGTCLGAGTIAMKFTTEDRKGLIQQYADKDSNYVYDSDAPRIGLRRWKTSTAADERDRDILCDNATGGNCTSTTRTTLLKELLNAFSKEPGIDPDTPRLGTMMADMVNYFSGNASTYDDKDSAYTQTPYKWETDPAKACRKTFAIFVTTGEYLDGTALTLSPDCNTLSYTDPFVKDTCYAFNKDLYTTDGTPPKQNIRTYIVHTTFYGSGSANEPKLTYASRTVGGGEYIKVANGAQLKSKLEEAILNILSTSASASTVATLTTQTRESSTLTQAYFYPKKEGTPLRWIGYLRLFWSDSGANLREDTMNTGWLDLKKDNILSFYYAPTGCGGGPCYKVKTYADSTGDLKIDSCSVPYADKDNEAALAIWNAQDKLLTRSPNDRTIKIGIGNTSGVVAGSDCTTTSGSGCYNFTTSLASTLQPFWNYSSFCSNYASRWCAQNSDCNYCNTLRGMTPIVDRGCSSASDCNYCDNRKTRLCSTSLTCIATADGADLGAGGCAAAGSPCAVGAGVCVGDCYEYSGTCDTGGSLGLVCDIDGTTSCADVGSTCMTTGTCKAKCTLNTTQLCTNNSQCLNDYTDDGVGVPPASGCVTAGAGECITAGFTCNTECDSANCATSVIKYLQGYDKPTPDGSAFRLRHETITTPDNTNTLKLGDIVYSTPRISPNSAVNGYDITYKDDSYAGFIASDTVKQATPIVLVGANDGMVHAFKVGKIRDVSPAVTNAGGVSDGYAIARFSDYPPTADTAPPSDIGKELWSYIPYNAVPYLRWYCNESYCHIPMVDARFTVIDASVDYDKDGTVEAVEGRSPTDKRCTTAADTPNDSSCPDYPWRRLLVGAMGVGGKQITVGGKTLSSSVFVLDITDPLVPKLLWERPLPDGTLTGGTPAVIRLSSKPAGGSPAADTENGEWYLVMGSGPKSVETNQTVYKTSENAKIYAFNLRTGVLAGTIDIGASGVAVGDMLPIDFDSDYQVDDIYFGTYGGTGATQTGKLYRLRIRDGSSYRTAPATWNISTVIDANRPIYASPEVAQDVSGNIWLYFGTGLYLSLEHAAATTDNEYLYGVKETTDCWRGTGTCTSPYTSFLNTSGITFTGAKAVELGCFCAGGLSSTHKCQPAGTCPASPCGASEDTVVLKVEDATISGTGIPAACSGKKDKDAIDCLSNEIASYNGWRRAISGQKNFSKPFVAGGLVDFTAFEPTSTVCSLGGNTHLLSLHYTTGTPYVQPTILVAGGTSGTLSSLTLSASVNLGVGIPPMGESLVALPLAGDAYKVITQVSGGLSGTGFVPSLPARPGYVLWQVK